MSQAIGIIETIGLAAAIEAADTAVKSANVRLIGYERSKGGGWITVKFSGDVGAVKAAVSSGAAAAGLVNKVVSTLILARPHEDLEPLINTTDMPRPPNGPGTPQPPEDVASQIIEQPAEILEEATQVAEEGLSEPEASPSSEEPPAETPSTVELKVADQSQKVTCNVCGQPDCPRKKGEPRSNCIHINKGDQ